MAKRSVKSREFGIGGNWRTLSTELAKSRFSLLALIYVCVLCHFVPSPCSILSKVFFRLKLEENVLKVKTYQNVKKLKPAKNVESFKKVNKKFNI